ncbi:MAG: DUF2149 domain-containing protein [Clostridiales Family XIII bacterium]|jgi:hypothetical protein|nr:DUF2149 domain-containing protein [Clostridiales Family XIII bacterium]
MARDFSTSRFLSSGFDSEPDMDPRVGLVNLADVMLVFACGLMLALVAYWNLDISDMREVIQSEQVTEMRDVEEITDAAAGGDGFIELGKVYQDPMTGKFYMLQEDMDKAQANEPGDATDKGGADESADDATEEMNE